MTMNRFALALLALSAGCNAIDDVDPEATPSTFAVNISQTDAAAIVALVNYPGTTDDVLHRQAGVEARAAQNIINARNGADGITPSADDVLFADIAAIDAVPYVGDAAFAKMNAWAAAHPAPAGEDVEGVVFTGWESQAVTWSLNHSTEAQLDTIMDARAAKAIFASLPVANVTAIGPLPYVGATVLNKLHSQAAADWTAMHTTVPTHAGTFDGVTFDDAAAEVALKIANDASVSEMTAEKITSTAAAKIVAGRPYAGLDQVAALSGVGTATMNALLAYALSGHWAAEACVNAFDDAVGPHLADLLFTSESDRPFDLVSFPGQGGAAPTADSLKALLKVPSTWTVEVRPTDYFDYGYEPSSNTADMNATALVQAAIKAQLTDTIYIAVHRPDSDPYKAEVQVYLIGRTTCGDLVGLHSVAVET
jgi:hypothetical protein